MIVQTARMSQSDDLISTKEATDLLGYANTSSVVRLVYEHKLTPVRQMGGKNGAYIFDRKDVEAYRDARPSIGGLIESGAVATIVVSPDSAA